MTSCTSSVSVQRSTKSEDHRSKSCETVCTSNSSCFLQRRKPMNPLMYPVRSTYTKSTGNSIRQRVLSAKLLKLRSLQSQLTDANFHLTEIAKENQTLKNLQKRQDKALSKYEGMNEDLPRLIHSYEEQTRVLTEKNKSLRKRVRELTDGLKTTEEELLKTQEKLFHLEKLNKDKHLIEREKLMDQLEDMKMKLQKTDEQITFLNRKVILESKTAKQRVNSEMMKHKQCQRELDKALAEVDRLTALLEAKENVVHPRKNRFSRQSVSMVTLGNFLPNRKKLAKITDDEELQHSNKAPVTDVKLEPIKCKVEGRKITSILNNIPSENIKNRLSSASSQSRNSAESSSLNNNKELSSGSEVSLDICDNSGGSSEVNNRADSALNFENLVDSPKEENAKELKCESNIELDKLTNDLDAAIQRATGKHY
ncbi:hypothetical protein NQ317_002404 [Molorchus minor]|uniref:Lebercilin domain-containing protein n=1 Tax=Molorchus minor TaxID=1323400 RepID=A0ABQ9JJX1_9CUCU|nr:hypothetical protein NQ317_002404 [Molorchus minor]